MTSKEGKGLKKSNKNEEKNTKKRQLDRMESQRKREFNLLVTEAMSGMKRSRKAVEDVQITKESEREVVEGELSALELARIENIRKNEQFLNTLGVDSVKYSLESSKPEKPKRSTKGTSSGSGPNVRLAPTRRSSRVTTEKLKSEIEEHLANGETEEAKTKQAILDEMTEKQNQGAYEVVAEAAEAPVVRITEPLSFYQMSNVKGNLSEDYQLQEGEELYRLLTSSVDKKSVKVEKKASKYVSNSYLERMNRLSLDENHVAKLTEARITSTYIHPSATATIVASGDKVGFLGIWNVDYVASDENGSSASVQKEGIYKYKPHTSNICTIYTPMEDQTKLYTVSYDNTIKCIDLNTKAFQPVFISSEEEYLSNAYYTDAAFSPHNPNLAFISKSNGFVSLVDFRAVTASKSQYQFTGRVQDGTKLNSIQQHPTDENLLITAGKVNISIHDIRKQAATNWKPVVELDEHNKSINAAYCSPSGDYLVSVAQDNTVKVFHNFISAKVKYDVISLKHDNLTGRWLSTFRPVFDPKEEGIFCLGSMEQPRRMELFQCNHSGGGLKVSLLKNLQNDWLGSVCSRNAFHASRDIVVGGNSSGRVHVFR